jgi:two-component sensor histidine kinase
VIIQNRILENRVAERTKDLDKNIHELNQEIIERKKAEEKVQASLKEKEVLLKEIHHRVKNNLQVISSLLYLQSITVKDEDTINLFNDSQNRIKSMALIHEKLYQSDNFAFIDFGEYVKSLVDYFNRSFNRKDPFIRTSIHIEDVFLSLDTAISCGLIVNELMTNTHKYAFPERWIEHNKRENGYLIEISMEKKGDNSFVLIVRDDGIGIPDEIDITETDSLGLKIVASMADQMNGKIEISGKNGTEFKISFTDLKQN